MNPKIETLLQLIAEKSATADGFFTSAARAILHQKTVCAVCRQLVDDGKLFRVRMGTAAYAHFSTPELAAEYRGKRQAAMLKKAATKISFESSATAGPRPGAEVIYPAGYRHTVTLMAPPRNQVITIPFIHGIMGAMQ